MARFSLAICLIFIIVASSALYEAQGHFLLKDYLKEFPKTHREFSPFAFKGMLSFVDSLEGLCPLKEKYKEFFTELKAFMTFINSASGSSSEFNSQLKEQSEGLFKAIATLSGKAGSSGDTSKLIDSLTSMGKTLVEYKRAGSQTITTHQRTKLMTSMTKWAQGIGQFVKKVGEKSGDCNIDLTTLGIEGGSTGDSGTPSSDTGSPSDQTGSPATSDGPNSDSGSPSGETGSPVEGGNSAESPGSSIEGGSGSPSGSPSDSSGDGDGDGAAAGGPSGSTSDISTGGESSMGGGGSFSDTTGRNTMESPVGGVSADGSGDTILLAKAGCGDSASNQKTIVSGNGKS